MTEQEDRWLHELEQATAPPEDPAESLDAQTAELREGWQALACLLERIDAEPWPAEGALDRLTQTLPAPVSPAEISASSSVVSGAGPQAWARGRWTWVAIAGGAIAASLLLGAFLMSWRSGPTESPLEAPQIAQPSLAPASPTAPALPTAPASPIRREPLAEALAWDDPLKDQFDRLASGIASFRASQSPLDSSCDWLDQRLEGLSEELDEL